MKVQFIFATVNFKLHRDNRAALEKTKDYLVVNQLHAEAKTAAGTEAGGTHTCDAKTHNFPEKGLCRSRNRAIELCEADIGYFCDEDLDFVDAPGDVVAAAYERHHDADIIIFNSRTPDGKEVCARRDSPPILAAARTLLSARSCMLSFRRAALLAAGVRFDERFGLGTEFPTGAENIFLFDCQRAGLKIVLDSSVVTIHPRDSSGTQLGDERIARAKGAVFSRIFPKAYPLYLLLSCLKMRPLYREHHSPLGFLRLMLRGRAAFRRRYGPN